MPHTPGWHLREGDHAISIHDEFDEKINLSPLRIGSRQLVFPAPRSAVRRGEQIQYGKFSAEDLAKARLIAAAPDLLASVKTLLPCAWGHDKPDCKGDCKTCQAIIAARAVIAKAEGE